MRRDLEHTNKRRKLLDQDIFTNFIFTATTNKAASLLENGETIFKFLGLSIRQNNKTGKKAAAKTQKSVIHKNIVICIDEASMIGPELFTIIDELTSNCKLIFIGDENQLSPIGCENIPVFNSGFEVVTLDEPMRQDKDSQLFSACTDLRDAVIKGVTSTISLGEQVISLPPTEFLQTMKDAYIAKEDVKTIAYTNKHTIKINAFFRRALGFESDWQIGDTVITKNAALSISATNMTFVELEDEITDIQEDIQLHLDIPYRRVTLKFAGAFRVPTDMDVLNSEKYTCKGHKDWKRFFQLESDFLDIRNGFASTAHSAQGSSYDKVFIDLTDMAKCYDKDTLRRMLYVSVSRARKQVMVYGL